MVQDGMKQFKPAALERLSELIASRYTGWQITQFFEKAGFPEYQHDGSTKKWFVLTALTQIQAGVDGPLGIVTIIQQLCDPEEYFGEGEYHVRLIAQVNEMLGFYGLAVADEDGTVSATGQITRALGTSVSEDSRMFKSRGYHSIVSKHATLLFQQGRYFHAVFECCKALDKYIRARSKLEKHGTELMSTALSLKGPLKLNSLQTETEKNEQQRYMYLCMGLMQAIRNPTSHELENDWPISRDDALDMLSLISYLFRQADKLQP